MGVCNPPLPELWVVCNPPLPELWVVCNPPLPELLKRYELKSVKTDASQANFTINAYRSLILELFV
ncbi:MAG: hypothetical protein WCS37_04345 [Chloroflexota bacterium]